MSARLRLGIPWLAPAYWVVALSLAAGLGLLMDRMPAVVVAAVTVVVFVAVVGQTAHIPVTLVFVGAVLLSSALVDLPSRVHIGEFSANAGLTGAYAFVGVLIATQWARSTSRAAAKPLWPFLALLALGLIWLGWSDRSIDAIQNVLVLLVFTASVLCGIEVSAHGRGSQRAVERTLGAASLTAIGLYGAGLAAEGVGSGAVIGSRSFALFALVVIAWGVAGWRYQRPLGRALTVVAGVLVVLSLSRIAFAAALVVCSLVWLNPRSTAGWFRFLAVVSVAIGIAYTATETIRPLHDRIYTGDVQSIGGGVSINVTGRSDYWDTVWQSYLTSPHIGQGVGSADRLIEDTYSESAGHPHNDYLRLLHDYGLLGASLWLLGCGWLLARSWRSWQNNRVNRLATPSEIAIHQRFHAAAFLSLLAISIAMITDNPVTYLFVMGPLGALIGLSLGLRHQVDSDGPMSASGISTDPHHGG